MADARPSPANILVYSGQERIGEGFAKLPFLRSLRATWPDARITWLAGQGRSVYAGNLGELVRPYLDEVIDDAGIGVRMRELCSQPLPERGFDLVIDTQRRVLTTLILRRIATQLFVSGAAGFRLSDARPQGYRGKPPTSTAQLFDLLRAATGREPIPGPPISIAPRFEEAARSAVPDGPPALGLVPGAGGRHKCWPADRYEKLARLAGRCGLRPLVLLGPSEQSWIMPLRRALPQALFPLQDPRLPRDVAASPIFTMALGRRLALAVSNDCGTARILAAADTPLIGLFGPTDPAKLGRITSDYTAIRAQDFGGESMALIPFDAVWKLVGKKLAVQSGAERTESGSTKRAIRTDVSCVT